MNTDSTLLLYNEAREYFKDALGDTSVVFACDGNDKVHCLSRALLSMLSPEVWKKSLECRLWRGKKEALTIYDMTRAEFDVIVNLWMEPESTVFSVEQAFHLLMAADANGISGVVFEKLKRTVLDGLSSTSRWFEEISSHVEIPERIMREVLLPYFLERPGHKLPHPSVVECLEKAKHRMDGAGLLWTGKRKRDAVENENWFRLVDDRDTGRVRLIGKSRETRNVMVTRVYAAGGTIYCMLYVLGVQFIVAIDAITKTLTACRNLEWFNHALPQEVHASMFIQEDLIQTSIGRIMISKTTDVLSGDRVKVVNIYISNNAEPFLWEMGQQSTLAAFVVTVDPTTVVYCKDDRGKYTKLYTLSRSAGQYADLQIGFPDHKNCGILVSKTQFIAGMAHATKPYPHRGIGVFMDGVLTHAVEIPAPGVTWRSYQFCYKNNRLYQPGADHEVLVFDANTLARLNRIDLGPYPQYSLDSSRLVLHGEKILVCCSMRMKKVLVIAIDSHTVAPVGTRTMELSDSCYLVHEILALPGALVWVGCDGSFCVEGR